MVLINSLILFFDDSVNLYGSIETYVNLCFVKSASISCAFFLYFLKSDYLQSLSDKYLFFGSTVKSYSTHVIHLEKCDIRI